MLGGRSETSMTTKPKRAEQQARALRAGRAAPVHRGSRTCKNTRPLPGHRLTHWHGRATWSKRHGKMVTHRGTSRCSEERKSLLTMSAGGSAQKTPETAIKIEEFTMRAALSSADTVGLVREKDPLIGMSTYRSGRDKFLRKFQRSPFFLPSKSENSDAFLIPKTGPSSS